MRLLRYGLLAVTMLALLGLAACRAAPPAVSIEPAAQDLGERPQQLVELTYAVRNTGGSALPVSKITTSCECTKATMDRTEIPAGESSAVARHVGSNRG